MVERQNFARGQRAHPPKRKRPEEERWRVGDDWAIHYMMLLICSVALVGAVLYGLNMAGQSYTDYARLHAGSNCTGQAAKAKLPQSLM